MSSTAASLEPPWNEIDAFYGISIYQPMGDLPARRHLRPSVMDGKVPVADLCLCPGGPDAEVPCIDVRSGPDSDLCVMCGRYCYDTTESGEQILFVDRHRTIAESSSEVGSVPDGTTSEIGQ